MRLLKAELQSSGMAPKFMKASGKDGKVPQTGNETVVKDCVKVMTENEVKMGQVYKDTTQV